MSKKNEVVKRGKGVRGCRNSLPRLRARIIVLGVKRKSQEERESQIQRVRLSDFRTPRAWNGRATQGGAQMARKSCRRRKDRISMGGSVFQSI